MPFDPERHFKIIHNGRPKGGSEMIGKFEGKHILHGNQFSNEDLDKIMQVADEFEHGLEEGMTYDLMKGRILAALFFEPSTRTRLSFESAMLRLGGGVISVASGATSSAAKGESIQDTALTVSQYAHVIVIRHPQIGSAAEAAASATVPVINAGDGAGQHPTQALLDVYTIKKELGTLDGITISLVGDLKYGRTAHALVELLSLYDIGLRFVSPESLKMPADIVERLKHKGREIIETEDLVEAAADSDLIYVTRIQKERFPDIKDYEKIDGVYVIRMQKESFPDIKDYEKIKGVYVIDETLLKEAKKGVVIMHPLPRVDEISVSVDSYEGAAYFRQVRNGIYVRMALLALVLGVK
jgi:aspartate carbamoyltransferase catalytic subunit